MTTIKITTSTMTTMVSVPSPIDEVIEIQYGDCLYCGRPYRKNPRYSAHKFDCDKCRVLYCIHGIAEAKTHSRYNGVLTHR